MTESHSIQLKTNLGHLLIVDDDELVRDFLQTSLEDEGYSCAIAANGIEAIQSLRHNATPDVILLDLNMPGVDGLEFLRLASEHIGAAFGVIVMSGLSGPRLKEQVMRYGAFTMIEKPIDMAKLLRLIRIQVDYRKTRANLR
ncbi:MAG TPA: response regulator [Terriglobales bacterium]|nr:response regulator [Terriglobales bacterium]